MNGFKLLLSVLNPFDRVGDLQEFLISFCSKQTKRVNAEFGIFWRETIFFKTNISVIT